MKINKLLIFAFVITFNAAIAQEKSKVSEIKTLEKSYLELRSIQVVPIKDTKSGSQYELYIKLPEAYSENKDIQYPVLYFTDALWQIEMLSGSSEYIVKDAILVGISWQKDLEGELAATRPHASRFRDYSTYQSNNPEHQAKFQFGQASNHLEFVRNDVIQYIENNYCYPTKSYFKKKTSFPVFKQ